MFEAVIVYIVTENNGYIVGSIVVPLGIIFAFVNYNTERWKNISIQSLDEPQRDRWVDG